MAQWVKLSNGWIDLEQAAYIATMPNDILVLHDGIASKDTGSRHISGDDAAAIRAYLDRVAVNKPEASRQLRGLKSRLY